MYERLDGIVYHPDPANRNNVTAGNTFTDGAIHVHLQVGDTSPVSAVTRALDLQNITDTAQRASLASKSVVVGLGVAHYGLRARQGFSVFIPPPNS